MQIKGRLFSTDLNSSAAALSAAGFAFSGRFSSYLVRRCLVFFRPFSEDLALSGPQLTYKVGFEAALWLLAPGFFRHVPLGAAVWCSLARRCGAHWRSAVKILKGPNSVSIVCSSVLTITIRSALDPAITKKSYRFRSSCQKNQSHIQKVNVIRYFSEPTFILSVLKIGVTKGCLMIFNFRLTKNKNGKKKQNHYE